MAPSESTLHCSFIAYLDKNSASAEAFLKDCITFFGKFPLSYELLFVSKTPLSFIDLADYPQVELLNLVNSAAPRAEALRQALSAARGEYLILLDPYLDTPLADTFKILQTLMTSDDLDCCMGERLSKAQSPLHQKNQWRLRIESDFNRILQDRFQNRNTDFYCEMGGFKKQAWAEINKTLPPRLSGAYFLIQTYAAQKEIQLKTERIYIHDAGKYPRHPSRLRTRWELFKNSIFLK